MVDLWYSDSRHTVITRSSAPGGVSAPPGASPTVGVGNHRAVSIVGEYLALVYWAAPHIRSTMGAEMTTRRRAATLVRLALVEVGAYPVVAPRRAWEEQLRITAPKLTPEDGWALAQAAELLVAHPAPQFWGKVAAGIGRSRSG